MRVSKYFFIFGVTLPYLMFMLLFVGKHVAANILCPAQGLEDR